MDATLFGTRMLLVVDRCCECFLRTLEAGGGAGGAVGIVAAVHVITAVMVAVLCLIVVALLCG